jgi:hypothetical protein
VLQRERECVRVCVYVCVWERERKRERQTHKAVDQNWLPKGDVKVHSSKPWIMMKNVTHLSFLRLWSTTWGQYILTLVFRLWKNYSISTSEQFDVKVEYEVVQQQAWECSVTGSDKGDFPLQNREYADLFNSRSFCTHYRKECNIHTVVYCDVMSYLEVLC